MGILNTAKYIFFGAMIYLVIYVVVIEESWLQSTMRQEQQVNYQLLGGDRARNAEASATTAFNTLFVRTKMVEKSFTLFVPSKEQQVNSKGIETAGSTYFIWVEKRIRAAWTLVYQVLLRIFTAALWWPFMVIIGVAFLIDALVARKVKLMSFAITSPHIQGLAMRSIPIVIIGYLLLLFSPILVHPGWVPILSFTTGLAVWLAVTQFVKRG